MGFFCFRPSRSGPLDQAWPMATSCLLEAEQVAVVAGIFAVAAPSKINFRNSAAPTGLMGFDRAAFPGRPPRFAQGCPGLFSTAPSGSQSQFGDFESATATLSAVRAWAAAWPWPPGGRRRNSSVEYRIPCAASRARSWFPFFFPARNSEAKRAPDARLLACGRSAGCGGRRCCWCSALEQIDCGGRQRLVSIGKKHAHLPHLVVGQHVFE